MLKQKYCHQNLAQQLNLAGNNFGNLTDNQDALSRVLYVGIYDEDKKSFSNYPGANKTLQKRFIMIPIKTINLTQSDVNVDNSFSGTSYATAIASASIALLMGEDVTLSALDAADIILET